MRTKIEQFTLSRATEQFIVEPNYLSCYNLLICLQKDRANFKDNKKLIIQLIETSKLNGNGVTIEAEHIVYALFAVVNLSMGLNIKHNTQQIVNRFASIDPDKAQYADMIWNIFAIVFIRVPNDTVVHLPKQWEALIPGYSNMSNSQIYTYCAGMALVENIKNVEAWLHLASLFYYQSVVLSALPPKLIHFIKHAISGLDSERLVLFCCEQALSNKCNVELAQTANFFKAQTHKRMQSIGATPSSSALVPPVDLTLDTTVPVHNPNQILILDKLLNRLKTREKISVILSRCDFTIQELKTAINSLDCLINVLNTIRPKSERHVLIYELFKHPDAGKGNSCRKRCDEEYIKTIIKTKNDFDLILNTLPEDTASYQIYSRVKNKYLKTSGHINSLYKNNTNELKECLSTTTGLTPQSSMVGRHGQLSSLIQPMMARNTLFSAKPALTSTILNHSITLTTAPVINAIKIDILDLTENDSQKINSQEMQIETSTTPVRIKREFEVSDESDIAESATKKLKF